VVKQSVFKFTDDSIEKYADANFTKNHAIMS